jgi:rhodanese-related sulfurtransferase
MNEADVARSVGGTTMATHLKTEDAKGPEPETSHVVEYGCPQPGETKREMHDKLRFETDSWDLAQDLTRQHAGIAVLDVRPRDAYERGHIPGATSFPHREMSEATTATLDRDTVYVVYCDGIGCNGSTKGAYKLASLGFKAKELVGGLDWWRRDGHAVVTGPDRGDFRAAKQRV